ncbi:MAG: hypothetical protein RLZZ338_1177 [Cyanobacteriota bacterium]|jgi:monoamine oxidase
MAKSPLMSALRAAYNIAQLSRKTGIPVDELSGMMRDCVSLNHRISRRHLLQGGLAMGSAIVAASYPRQPVWAQTSARSSILIVGAGLAGLTAGYRLKQAGVQTDIIEATNRIGGRVRSLNKTLGTATITELGGEFIDSSHVTVLTLATELGLIAIDLLNVQQGLVAQTFFFQGRRVSVEQLAQDMIILSEKIDLARNQIGDVVTYKSFNQRASELDATSLAAYLEQAQITPLLQQAINIAYLAEFGLDTEEQSSLNLISLIGTDVGKFKIYGESDERYQIQGGNNQITNQLAANLSNSIETGIALESINILSDGRYRVGLRAGQSAFERVYERILLTIPFSTLRNVQINANLPPLKQYAINQLGYGTNAKVLTSYRSRIWKDLYQSSAETYTDLNYQTSWEASPFSTGSNSVVTFFLGGTSGLAIGSGVPNSHAAPFVNQFNNVFQGVKNDRLNSKAFRAYWPGERYALGSYSCYLVGQWTRIRGVEGEKVGNLYFAGEHTSLDNQGYMEGSCETGETAAISILKDLGLKAAADALTKTRSGQSVTRKNRFF